MVRIALAAALLPLLLRPVATAQPTRGSTTPSETDISPPDNAVTIDGPRRQWHPITFTMTGPDVQEVASTFRDYRFDMIFEHQGTGQELRVPGFFAADGNAAHSSADTGDQWRAVFTPPHVGTWSYRVSFLEGADVAVATDPRAGEPNQYDGLTGTVTVKPSNKEAPDVRSRGFLTYNGTAYYQYADGSRYLGIGMDSPENFLEYEGIDGTVNLDGTNYVRDWQAHRQHWTAGDPTWQGGEPGAEKGKGLIGAINYIADRSINQQYFITMNVEGDGRAAYPYTPAAASTKQLEIFDVSKLAQWRIVVEHMMRKGITAHILLAETENELLFEQGSDADTSNIFRELYYREMIARLGWHPALIWNLGEEHNHTSNSPHGNASSASQREAWARYIHAVDPYDHPVTVHNWQVTQSDYLSLYNGFLGVKVFDGPSLQWDHGIAEEVRRWHHKADSVGRPWVVMMTEYNGGGQSAHDEKRDMWRKAALWEPLMNRAGAVELYFGNAGGVDVKTEDLRPWADAFRQMEHAARVFEQLPLDEMEIADGTAQTAGATYALRETGETYLIYWEAADSVGSVDLTNHGGSYRVRWMNPRTGKMHEMAPIKGNDVVQLPDPPAAPADDWALMIQAR